MTFGTTSAAFRPFIADSITGDVALKVGAASTPDTLKCAIFGNTGTPDKNATRANSAYGAGAWVTGNEVTDTNWPAGGRALSSVVVDSGTAGVVFLDAADLSGAGNVTMANIYGCLIYDDTLTTPTADQGVCFNSFGGAQSVSAGSLTLQWSANGIVRWSL